jgi:hypothetical protein
MLHINEQTVVKAIAAGGNHRERTSDHEPGVGNRDETKEAMKKTENTSKNRLQFRVPLGGDAVMMLVLMFVAT